MAGQIDCIFLDTAGKYHMVDWKRVERDLDPLYGLCFGKYGFGPCHELLDNSFNHYAAQQSLYAMILEKCYKRNLTSMWLAQLHCMRPNFQVLEVPFLPDMVMKMLQQTCKESEAAEMVHQVNEPK